VGPAPTVQETDTEVVVDNGLVRLTVDKSNGRTTSLVYDGVNMVGRGNYDMNTVRDGGALPLPPADDHLTVRREQGTLRWSVTKNALWLRAPRSPRTGRRGGRLWWLLVPLILAVAAKEELPKIPAPVHRDQGLFLQSVAGQDFFAGNWLWFAVIVTMMIFNTVLGEELLFRGLLLPRMRGAFGRWDWLVNGVLFGIYHLHLPWSIPANTLDTFFISFPASRYHSALIGIVVHSVQTVVFTALLLTLVLR